jgi:Ca2+-binding RTX toxin-like protein
LTGSGFDDVIHGGSGNDTINGAAGNDIIYGSAGADSMSGGADRDTFLYKALSEGTATETISGFTTGATGDVLDLHELLVDFAPGYDGTNAFTGGYVTFDTSSVTNTVVKIDADGSAGIGAAVTLVTLTGVVLTTGDTDNYTV